uniref:Protein YIPF n=1 Tax=Acrobeloides nanus TaxID=290746 RepID=A0A914BXN6_9BILA
MSNLQFQDFNFGDLADSPFTAASSNSGQDYKPANKQHSIIPGLVGNTDEGSATTTSGLQNNVFSFKFYQQYFDVDTEQVQNRLLNSFIPKWSKNFITDYIQPLPDLYGPLWICITLIFSTAICGNLAHYIDTNGEGDSRPGNDFSLVTGASSLVASYVILVPFFIYCLLWYRKSAIQYSYLEILCAYGYSLSIFIPVSILWVVHYQWFRWSLIIVSLVLSGTVIVQWVWSAIKTDSNRMVAYGAVLGTLGLHALLAIAFKEFYFDSVILPQGRSSAPTIDSLPSTLSPQALVASSALAPAPSSNNTQENNVKGVAQNAVQSEQNKKPVADSQVRDDSQTQGNEKTNLTITEPKESTKAQLTSSSNKESKNEDGKPLQKNENNDETKKINQEHNTTTIKE